MYRRSVRHHNRPQQDKENCNLQEQEELQENYPEKKQDPKTFYLIVEAAARETPASGLSQYWLISSNNIVDIPVVSPETVYTGKQLKFQLNDQQVSSGTCVLFSADFSFVQAQFTQIKPTDMEHGVDKALKTASPKVLNYSNRANIQAGLKGKLVKIPNVITLKQVVVPKKELIVTDENMMEIPELGDPDSENRPPGQAEEILTINGRGAARVMTFDQQSQTDSTMLDSVLPATASQMHQQSSQLAQLIRANNGLVNEVKQLKESTSQIKQTMNEMNTKLTNALALLAALPKGDTTTTTTYTEIVPVADISCNESVVSGYHDSSVDHYASYSNLSTAAPSREQSVARSVKSENTPPLKKNKAKLSDSLRMALAEQDENNPDELLSIGEHGTMVPKTVFHCLKYDSFSTVTRKILSAVFDRATLASHSLTGKPSPAFLERGAKMQLDANKIADIVKYVTESCGVTEAAVRGVITSKCADENKMLRLHAKKRQSIAANPDSSESASKRRQTMHN